VTPRHRQLRNRKTPATLSKDPLSNLAVSVIKVDGDNSLTTNIYRVSSAPGQDRFARVGQRFPSRLRDITVLGFPRCPTISGAFCESVFFDDTKRMKVLNAARRELLLFLLPVMAGFAVDAQVPLKVELQEPAWFKANHGYVVAFNKRQRTKGGDSIEVFDRHGSRVFALDVMSRISGAIEVDLDDVALVPYRSLVAGAIVLRAGGAQAMLLYFTWEGLLVKSVDLPPEQEVSNLDVDEDGSVWTLTDYLGRDDETVGPLIFEYDGTGRLVKGLLHRTDYPAGFEVGSHNGGTVGFGLTLEAIWFWQPVRHKMTVVSRDGKVLKKISVALPKSRPEHQRLHPPEADFEALLPSGHVVAGIVSPWGDVPTGAYISKGKRFVRRSAESLLLIGVEGSELIFLKQFDRQSNNIEIVREPIPPNVS
jgi:hypothetical protein